MSQGFSLSRLMLVTNRHIASRSLAEVIDEACSSGARLIHLREKDLMGKPLYELALSLKKITTGYNADLILSSRLDIALSTNADAIHLPEAALPVQSVRRFFEKWIGRSVHSVQGAIEAESSGADYILFGHIFETPAKVSPPQGVCALASVCAAVNIPVYAIGGVTPETAKACLDAGAYGIAVMNGAMRAPNLSEIIIHYSNLLKC